MERYQTSQRRKLLYSFLYAAIVGLLVLSCAVVISAVNKDKPLSSDISIGEEIQVSSTVFVNPMKNATIVKDYSASELQYNDTLKQWEIHKAVDFVSAESSDVFAVADGRVTNVYTNYLEGTVIEITHANGIVTVYKSLAETNVAIGDKVGAGQKIGLASESMAQELNAGAHLHFEIFENGIKVNPNNYLDLGSK